MLLPLLVRIDSILLTHVDSLSTFSCRLDRLSLIVLSNSWWEREKGGHIQGIVNTTSPLQHVQCTYLLWLHIIGLVKLFVKVRITLQERWESTGTYFKQKQLVSECEKNYLVIWLWCTFSFCKKRWKERSKDESLPALGLLSLINSIDES